LVIWLFGYLVLVFLEDINNLRNRVLAFLATL